MDLGPKSPKNEFVESVLINWALGNQKNLRMELDVERMKKEKGLCWNKSSSARSEEVCSYILFSVYKQIFILFVPLFLFPFYTVLHSRSYFTHVYWRVGVDTCPIFTFHQSPCSSCKAETHCSGITSILMQLES